MAAAVGTVLRAWGFDAAQGTPVVNTVSSNGVIVKTCRVAVQWPTGTYAQADNATFAPATVIQNARRDGKTVTILAACPVAAGRTQVTATPTTVAYPFALACTVSSGTITTQLTGSDLTTELTDSTDLATLTWTAPVVFQVAFHESTD